MARPRGVGRWYMTAVPVLAAAGVGLLAFSSRPADTSNYRMEYFQPKGWVHKEMAPMTLFLFEHPPTKALIRGSMQSVIDEINPSPELDTDGLAELQIENTSKNQPDWKATRLKDLWSSNERFSSVMRWRDGQVVVSAFNAKGNTTSIVSLSVRGRYVDAVDELLIELETFMKGVRIVPCELQ